jgi:hypothetical protein
MPPAARRLEPAEHDPTEISAADAVTFAPNVTVWVAQNWRGFPLSATIGGILHPRNWLWCTLSCSGSASAPPGRGLLLANSHHNSRSQPLSSPSRQRG